MIMTQKEKLKYSSLFYALLSCSVLSHAPLLASKFETDDEGPQRSSSNQAPHGTTAVLENPSHISTTPVVSRQPDLPVEEETSRALVVASPGFHFSFTNPFASLTKYVKKVDWRRMALIVLGEEDFSDGKDSAPKASSASSDEVQSKILDHKEEGDEGNPFRDFNPSETPHQSNPSGESEENHTSPEGGSNNGDGHAIPIPGSSEQPESQPETKLGDAVLEASDSALNGDSSLRGDNSLNVKDQAKEKSIERASIPDEHAHGEDDEGSIVPNKDDALEGRGSVVNGDSEGSILTNKPQKPRNAVFVGTPTPEEVKESVEFRGRGSFQSPRKKPATPVTPKMKVTKAVVTPKTPEEAGFRVKTKTDIGPIYHGLNYTYTNPKGEEKTLLGSRLAHFVGNSPHPKKFVLIQAQSPKKTRSAPFVISFAPKTLEEESSSEHDDSSGEVGSSEKSSSEK